MQIIGQRLPSQALAGGFGPPPVPHELSDMAKAMALATPSADLVLSRGLDCSETLWSA